MPSPGSIYMSDKSYKVLEEKMRSSLVSFANVKILNLTQSYIPVDVDKIFIDLQCEPFEFERKDLSCEEKIQPCLEVINYKSIEMSEHNHIVLLGLPGAGKTTLLKKVFKEYCNNDEVLPIYVELKQEEKRGRFSLLWENGESVSEINIRNYLVRYFEPLGIRIDNEMIDYLFDKFKIVFFCDGLDEISKEQYDKFTKTVQSLSCWQSLRFIISSRQVGFSRLDYADDSFKLYSLMDFNEEKQKQFIDKYFDWIIENGNGELNNLLERKEYLTNSLNKTVIKRMAKSPVLLSLLCVMQDVADINNKAQLFQKAIKVLLSSRNFISNSEQQLVINFLKEIAVIFFKLDKAENFDLSELTFYADRFFGNNNLETLEKLKNNDFNCGLFDKIDDEAGNNTYKFAHRTIWEFLVADGMATDGRDKNEIYNRANMVVWEEPIKMWLPLISQRHPHLQTEIFRELWKRNKALTLSCMSEIDPFPQTEFNILYGELSRRDKLRLVATLRDSYVNPSSDYRKQAINTIQETLTLIHSVEKDCEVIYSYINFLEEFQYESVFKSLFEKFLDYEHLNERMKIASECGLEFAHVPAGEFLMGRNKIDCSSMTEEEKKACINVDEEECPAHKVRISKAFDISKTLVTNKMFYDIGFPYLNCDKHGKPVYKNNPYSNDENEPVNYPNWYEAVIYAKWLGCTLATEAEWEYACRGCGKDDETYMSNKLEDMIKLLDKISCYASRNVGHSNETRPVLPINNEHANSLGLVDMLGNLREWCLDWYSDDFYKKCTLESGFYPTYNEDIKGKEFVSYYFNNDDKAILVSQELVSNADIFTFDSKGNCVDPVKKFPGRFEAKSLRGGCFDWNESNLRPTYRNHNPASNVYKVNGFRLVKKEG